MIELIPHLLQDAVDRELESDERVEWAGMPRPVFFTPTTTAAFLFGIPLTAIAAFFTTAVARVAIDAIINGGGYACVFPVLFGSPFVLIGLRLLASPLWVHQKAIRTVYVITDRRAITFDGGWSTAIRSYPPEKLTDVFRREKTDGSGDVVIAPRYRRNSHGHQQSEELAFLRIDDAQGVERRLRRLAKKGIASNPWEGTTEHYRPTRPGELD